VVADPGLSVAERAEKVKKTMDEYKALDHEDMVSTQSYSRNGLTCRSATCPRDSSTPGARPLISV